MTHEFDIRNSARGISWACRLALRGIEADLADCMVALPGQLFYKFRMN